MKRRIKFIFAMVALGLVMGIPGQVFGKKTIGDALPFVAKVAPATGVAQGDLSTTIGQVIKIALGLVGTIFFILMFYAGYLWFTSRGNDEKVEKAKNAIIAAVMGVTVSVLAYGVTNLVMDRLVARKSGPAAEVVGCCYDWVASNREIDITPHIKTWRMTTQSDCKYQGETPGVGGDFWAGPQGEGYWIFNENRDEQWCKDNMNPPSN